MALCSKNKNVGLYAHTLQFLHTVLCWLSLQLVGSLQIGYVRKVYTYRIAPQLPAQLSDSLHKRCTLYIAYGSAHFGNHKVQTFVQPLAQHASLYLVGNVWHNLYGLSQVVAVALTVYHRLVDATGGYTIVTCCVYACKSLVVAQIQVGLKPVFSNIALAVLVGVQRTRVDVNVGVKLLYCHFIAACLQQLAYAGRDDSLTK